MRTLMDPLASAARPASAAATASAARENATTKASPLRVHLDAAVRREGFAERAPVLGEDLRIPSAVFLEKSGRSLDVREQESDRAAGEIADCHGGIIADGRVVAGS